MLRILLALLICSAASALLAQTSNITISGHITDAATGEALIGANIYDLKSGKGTTANNYGFYSLTLPADSMYLRYSYVGYQTQVMPLKVITSQVINIALTGMTLGEVEIIGSQSEQEFERTRMSTLEIPLEKVRNLPVLLGERDVLKTIQLLPGVQSGTEGAAGLYVRGGGPDQNLILLDGVPIYNANHLFGFFSIFNTDAINSVRLVKGGFPAEYGGRLSSVIDMRMKEGNSKKIHGEGGIGLIASRLTLEGPIIKDKTSFMVSGRRTYLDVLTRPIIRNSADGIDGGYYFYDLNAKVNHKFSDRSRLFLSGYFGNDRFFARDEYASRGANSLYEDSFDSGLRWGNAIAALRWNYIINPKFFSNTTVTYSRYNFLVSSEYTSKWTENGVVMRDSYSAIQYRSGIEDYGAKVDFNYLPSPDHYIKFGGSYIYHIFNPGVNRFTDRNIYQNDQDTTYGSSKVFAHEFYGYVEDDWRLTDKLKVNAGLHVSGFSVNDKFYHSIQPRFSGRYLLDRRTSLKASYAHMAQYLHLLTNAGVGLPTDLWVPVTENIKPQLAHQVAAGVSRQLTEAYEVTFEAYYKIMENLIEYQEGASFLGNAQDWQSKVETGRGWSYGGEFLLERKFGRTSGWVGYTLSWTDRQFENLNFGRVFPYKYDRRHDVSVAVTHKFNERVDIGVVWVFGTGNAITLPTERYNGLVPDQYSFFGGNEIGHIESRNNYRMPSYHRLDLGVNLRKQTKWGERTWSFGLYNAYSRQNPFFLYFSNDEMGNRRLTQISLFPIIPSVTFNFKF